MDLFSFGLIDHPRWTEITKSQSHFKKEKKNIYIYLFTKNYDHKASLTMFISIKGRNRRIIKIKDPFLMISWNYQQDTELTTNK